MYAYSVAIKLSVANLASQGIKLLAGDLLAAHGAAVKLEDKLKALKTIAIGYGMQKIGGGMLSFLEKSVETSKEYTRQMSLLNRAGMSHKEVAEATAAAWKTSHEVITSSAAENLAAIRELRSVFGTEHMHEAYAILPVVQRTKAIMEALSGKSQEGVAFDMVKAIELRNTGAMSTATMQKNADMMSQTLMAFGGTLNVHDYHMALKQAKTSGMRLDDTFVYKYLPTLMQEVKTGTGGAQSAGTILETMRRAIAGGRISEKMIGNWLDSGLISASGIGHGGAHNRFIKPGSVAGTEMFLSNPYQWANEIAAPAIQKLMAKKHVGFDTATAMLFGDRNAEFGVSTMIKKAMQFERDRKLVDTGYNSYDNYQALLKSNPQLAQMAMQKQWENVQARIGYEILPTLIPLMIKFADTLNGISEWMKKHPVKTEWIVKGLVGFGIGMVVVGKALMTAGIIKFLGAGPIIGRILGFIANAVLLVGRALFLNPIGLVLTAIAAAAYLLWKNWDVVGPKLKALWEGIKTAVGKFIDWIHDKLASFKKGATTYLNDIANTEQASNGQIPDTSPNVPPSATTQTVQVHTQVNLPDGRALAEFVTKHQSKSIMFQKQTGPRLPDLNMGLPPVAAGYGNG